MATVVNFIDVTLQAAAARGVNLPTADIQLLPSAPLFKVAPDGSITPPAITFTATLIDLEAELTFNATGAPMTSPTARSVTVVGESMTGSSVTVIASATVNGRTYTKPCTISKLQDGTVGSTTYTWIKYADSAAGAGLSDDPTGKIYIGLAYNKTSPIESIIASDYTWSLIKGEDGVPGQPGKDGVQLFTWIKYSNSADGAGLYDQPTADTLYIGIAVNKITATESSNPADYVWSRFKGDQGVPGPALYTWIKYADSAAGAGLSDDPTNKAYIGFAYNKTTAVESENPADYAWSLNQGGQGVPGQPGKDGVTLYTWIKYSDAPDGTNLYDVPTDSTVYIGIAVNKATATESTNKADYTWSRFKGGQGVPGNPGQPGQRGTVDISAGTAGTAWSDSEATAAIAQTGYGVPQMLDVVTLYNQAAGFANTRYWNGSAWIPVSQVINGALLVKGTVAAEAVDTRGLSVKDLQGRVIVGIGAALDPAYAAPGTLNSDIAVGGRNLAEDSAFEGRLRPWTARSGAVLNSGLDPTPGNRNLLIESNGGDAYVEGQGPYIPVVPGRQYMLSCEYASAGTIVNSSSYFYYSNGDAVNLPLINSANSGGVRVRFSMPWTCPEGVTGLSPRFGIRCSAYSWMRVYDFDVQAGNTAAPWSPAPEDLLAAAQAKADAAANWAVEAGHTYAAAQAELARTNAQAYADGVVTAEEQRAINDATTKAENARVAAVNAAAADATAKAAVAATLSTWAGTSGRPTDISNLVRKGTFEDSQKGSWSDDCFVQAVDQTGAENVPLRISLISHQRDCYENGNASPITPGETIYVSGWLGTQDTGYSCGFGVGVLDKNGQIKSWAPVLALAPRQPWKYQEGSWTVPSTMVGYDGVAFIPSGLIPWIQQDCPPDAPNYLRVDGLWIGRHARGATVGAPAGTMVGGTDAGLVASRALNGDSAYNALPGISQQIADRLSKTSPSQLAATVTLATNGTLLAGTPDNGVYLTPVGLYCVQGGGVKVAIPISGDPTFAGRLIAAAGTLGSLRLAANGSIASGDFTGWDWPDSRSLGRPVVGFYLGPEGFIIGDYYAGKSYQIRADGNVYAPGFRIVDGQVYVDSPIITNPKLQTSLNVYIPVQQLRNVGGSSVTWSFSPVVSGGSGAVARYLWSFTARDGTAPITMVSSPSDSSVTLRATGAGWKYGYISLTIYDTNGAVASTSQDVSVQFGSTPEP